MGWIESFDSKNCFKFFGQDGKLQSDVGLNWTDAEAKCKSLGGHLASVTNAFSNNFVQGISRFFNIEISKS